MSTKNEVLKDLSAKDYGVKSRYHLRTDVKTKECEVTRPADPAKLAAYKAAHPEEFEPELLKANKKRLYSRTYSDNHVTGV